MNFVGNKIKELRKHYRISQKELAEGICTQGLISQIENNESAIPSSKLLYDIATRLGVDLNYFYSFGEAPRLEYINEVRNQVDMEIRKTNYQEVYEIVKLEEKNPLFDTPDLKQYLLWLKGICIFHLFKRKEEAIELIDQSLTLTPTTKKNLSPREIDILSSKAIILAESGDIIGADDLYKSLISSLEKVPFLPDKRLVIRIYYNAAKIAHLNNNFKKSISTCDLGIKYCIKNEVLYLLGELYYQKGESLYGLSTTNKDKAIKYMEQALWIFDKKEHELFYHYVLEEIKKIKEDTKQCLQS